jgi:hypothetical protein
MSWLFIGIAGGSALLSVGMAAATAPSYGSPASSSRKVANAALRALPNQRRLEAAARLGQKVEYESDNWMRPRDAWKAGLITDAEWQHYKKLNEEKGLGIFGNLMPGTEPLTTGPNQGQNQDKRTGSHGGYGVRVKGGHMQINLGKRTADFTGYSDADIQGKVARQMAEVSIGLQEKYGEDFAREAAAQAALADPEGTAARGMLADKINTMEAERKTRERPVAQALDASVLGELSTGAGVDGDAGAAITRALARRGDVTAGQGAVEADMATGLEGEDRMRARLQKGTAYLSSGLTPQDAAYREEQQSMANMAAFLGGRTPQSQFASLSGGQQGASPRVQGSGLPGVDPNLVGNSQAAGLGGYSAGVRAAASQVNPWFAGLNTAVNAASVAGNAGYKPFGTII